MPRYLNPHQRSALNRISPFVRRASAGMALVAAFGAYAQTYAITDLGSLGGSFSMALGVNARGEVTGNSFTAGDQAPHAFIYSDGKMLDLGTLGGTSSYADAIDDQGQVFGTTYTAGNASLRAFVYANGKMTDLGPLAGASSHAQSVNAAGEVAGSAYIGGSVSLHAYLYRDGSMQDLNELARASEAGWTLNSARAISASGQIVGFGTRSGETAAFLLTPVTSAKTDVPPRDDASRVRFATR